MISSPVMSPRVWKALPLRACDPPLLPIAQKQRAHCPALLSESQSRGEGRGEAGAVSTGCCQGFLPRTKGKYSSPSAHLSFRTNSSSAFPRFYSWVFNFPLYNIGKARGWWLGHNYSFKLSCLPRDMLKGSSA